MRASGIASFALLNVIASHIPDCVDKFIPLISADLNNTILGGQIDTLIIDIDKRFPTKNGTPGLIDRLMPYLSDEVKEGINEIRIYKSPLKALKAMSVQPNYQNNLLRILEGAKIKYEENMYDRSEATYGYEMSLYALQQSGWSLDVQNSCKELLQLTFAACEASHASVFGYINNMEGCFEALAMIPLNQPQVTFKQRLLSHLYSKIQEIRIRQSRSRIKMKIPLSSNSKTILNPVNSKVTLSNSGSPQRSGTKSRSQLTPYHCQQKLRIIQMKNQRLKRLKFRMSMRVHDNRSKFGQKYVCTNKECGTEYRISADMMITMIADLIPKDILESSETDKPDIMMEIHQMEQEIARAIEYADRDTEQIRRMILECANKKYQAASSGRANLDKVKQNISREDFTVNRKIVMELVSQIKLISDEEIEITLINGQVLRKENPDGDNSTIE